MKAKKRWQQIQRKRKRKARQPQRKSEPPRHPEFTAWWYSGRGKRR